MSEQPGGQPGGQQPQAAAGLSPDGLWWWDGTRWQTTVSPDGRWRWTGAQWVPHVAPARPGGGGATAVVITILAVVGILVLVGVFAVVVLLAMGNQLANVFSNVAVALNATP